MNFKFLLTNLKDLPCRHFLTWPIYLSSESAWKLSSKWHLHNSLVPILFPRLPKSSKLPKRKMFFGILRGKPADMDNSTFVAFSCQKSISQPCQTHSSAPLACATRILFPVSLMGFQNSFLFQLGWIIFEDYFDVSIKSTVRLAFKREKIPNVQYIF